MAFDTLETSLAVLDLLAVLEQKVRQHRKSLADEMGRAGESIALNVSEGRVRAGLDRRDLFRRAAGSAAHRKVAPLHHRSGRQRLRKRKRNRQR